LSLKSREGGDFLISAIIPARAGSKRINSKNTVLLGRHPLIAYSIIACKLAKNIDRVIVSTESRYIANIALKYGAEVPFYRPDSLACDDSSDLGFLDHFFSKINVDKVALIRPTSPLRNPSVLDSTISNYAEHYRSDFTGFRSMCESNHSPYKMFQIKNKQCIGFFDDYRGEKFYTNLPNQTFPKSYTPNGYIDVVLKDTILKQNSVFGNKIFGQETEEIIDIDNHFDLDLAGCQIDTKYDILSVFLDKLE
jgi:CMP-N,N'-diacetyllegionaminic acid synthase